MRSREFEWHPLAYHGYHRVLIAHTFQRPAVNLQSSLICCPFKLICAIWIPKSSKGLGAPIALISPIRRIKSNNRCPPASLVDAFAPGLVYSQLFPWLRGASDGSRTRDRQFFRLMLFPLSYFNRCRIQNPYTEHDALTTCQQSVPRRRNYIDQTLA